MGREGLEKLVGGGGWGGTKKTEILGWSDKHGLAGNKSTWFETWRIDQDGERCPSTPICTALSDVITKIKSCTFLPHIFKLFSSFFVSTFLIRVTLAEHRSQWRSEGSNLQSDVKTGPGTQLGPGWFWCALNESCNFHGLCLFFVRWFKYLHHCASRIR